MSIERRIYSQWAFTENESEKRDMNMAIYEDFRREYRISKSDTFYNKETKQREPINENDYDIIVKHVRSGYAHSLYEVLKNKPNLTKTELALICDNGNLCFGYDIREGLIAIHTD